MIALLRNTSIALGASIGALVVSAGLQELFVRLVPASRTIAFSSIDIGSWVGFFALLFSFVIAGIIQARWLRSDSVLPWVLSGPVIFIAIALLQGLNVSGCLRRWTALSHFDQISCGLFTATLLLPLLGALTGLLAFQLWKRQLSVNATV
jgi:hypothetical protein